MWVNHPHIITTTWSIYRFIRQKRTQTVAQETAVVLAGDWILFWSSLTKDNVNLQVFWHEHHGLDGAGGYPPEQTTQVPVMLLPLLPPSKIALSTTKSPNFSLLQEMEVSSPPGTVIGTISQQWSIIHPKWVYLQSTLNIETYTIRSVMLRLWNLCPLEEKEAGRLLWTYK